MSHFATMMLGGEPQQSLIFGPEMFCQVDVGGLYVRLHSKIKGSCVLFSN